MLTVYTVTGRKPDLYKRYMDNVAGVASGSEQYPGGGGTPGSPRLAHKAPVMQAKVLS